MQRVSRRLDRLDESDGRITGRMVRSNDPKLRVPFHEVAEKEAEEIK
jgi:hypothetical protein